MWNANTPNLVGVSTQLAHDPRISKRSETKLSGYTKKSPTKNDLTLFLPNGTKAIRYVE